MYNVINSPIFSLAAVNDSILVLKSATCAMIHPCPKTLLTEHKIMEVSSEEFDLSPIFMILFGKEEECFSMSCVQYS